MAPNSPACSFIHASMAGSRSTAPLNRSKSVFIVARLSAFGNLLTPVEWRSCSITERLPDSVDPSFQDYLQDKGQTKVFLQLGSLKNSVGTSRLSPDSPRFPPIPQGLT